jgi:hypothetical protein
MHVSGRTVELTTLTIKKDENMTVKDGEEIAKLLTVILIRIGIAP